MTWVRRVVLTGLLLVMLSYAVQHSSIFSALPASAQDEVFMITSVQLTGRITAEEGGAPIANVEVIAAPEFYTEGYPKGWSDNTGTYTLTLQAGNNYKFHFQPPITSPYALEYYPHKRTFEEATLIPVPIDTPLRLDVTLLSGGTIRGTVNSSWYDKPIYLPEVSLLDEQGRGVTSNLYSGFDGQGEPAGTYALYNVPAGNYYQLIFRANSHYGLDKRTLITVTPGATVTGPYAHLLYAGGVLSIATSPALPNTIALTIDRLPEPLVSLNGGNTWQYLPASPWIADEASFAYPDRFPQGGVVAGLAPRGAPEGGVRFLVGTAAYPFGAPPLESRVLAPGIYRSGDVGQSWSEATIQTPVDYSTCEDGRFSQPVVTPAEPMNLYILYRCPIFEGQRFYVSQDAGMTWHDRTTNEGQTIPLHYRTRIVVSPTVKDEIYLNNGENQWYRSTDSGLNWETKTFTVENFIFDGEEPTYLYGWTPYGINTVRVGMRSHDGGTTWEEWPQQPCPYSPNDDPPLLLATTGISQTFVLRCDYGTPGEAGLYRTENGGDSWRRMSEEIGWMLAMDYGNPGRLLLAKYDGLWASDNLGESWHRLLPYYLPFDTMPLYLPAVKGE